MHDIFLVVTWSDHTHTEQRLPLFGQTIRIGHDPYNDIVLPPHFTPIAPYHAALVWQAGACIIHDIEGVGTVYLNGKKLSEPGILKSDIPAYIGNPNSQRLFLRLQITDMQFTQVARAQIAEDTLPHYVKSLPPPNLPEHTQAYLLAGWSEDDYQTYEIQENIVIVGRSPTANLVVPEHLNFVSSLHFQIIRVDEHYYVQDKNSTNGTRLNHQLLQPDSLQRLTDGDIINIQSGEPDGLVWFVFHNPLAPQRAHHIVENSPHAKKLWGRILAYLRR